MGSDQQVSRGGVKGYCRAEMTAENKQSHTQHTVHHTGHGPWGSVPQHAYVPSDQDLYIYLTEPASLSCTVCTHTLIIRFIGHRESSCTTSVTS